MIKELKASSPLAALRSYAEAVCSFTNTTPVFEACISAHTSHEITIKSDSETLKQHLLTEQDIK